MNKALLRSVKRFYLEEFKKDNKRIVKKRFKQAHIDEVFAGFITTCYRLFGDHPDLDNITQFVMIICSIKPIQEFEYDAIIKK